MANSSTSNSQSISGDAQKAEECLPDHKLPENSKENLDAKLDHAIEETFPTSDPVSVKITKGGAIDYDQQNATSSAPTAEQGQASREGFEEFLQQSKEQIQGIARKASDAAQVHYDQSRRYVHDVSERYPQIERTFREGSQTISQKVTESRFLSVVLAGAVGYALAWMIHGSWQGQDDRLQDYARTRRGYRPERNG